MPHKQLSHTIMQHDYVKLHRLAVDRHLKEELNFQGCSNANALLFYYIIAKPTRFCHGLQEAAGILPVKSTQAKLKPIVDEMSETEIRNLLERYSDTGRSKHGLVRHMWQSIVYSILPHYARRITQMNLPFYSNGLVNITPDDKKLLLVYCDFRQHPHHKALLDWNLALPLDVPLTRAHLYMFRDIKPAAHTNRHGDHAFIGNAPAAAFPERKVKQNNDWIETITAADVVELREGKFFHWHTMQPVPPTFIWELARHKLRDDLSNADIAEVLNSPFMWTH